jgi:intracellular sulfur oxidation DsrE/DsrF family protein
MLHLDETIGRRTFLGSMAASAVGLTAMGLPGKLLADEKMPPPVSNKAEFEGWLKRIKGKHKQVFDAPSTNGGLPLAWARVFIMSNTQFGVPARDITSVLVLRHDAIPFAMNDDLWAKYDFGETFNVKSFLTGQREKTNFLWKPKQEPPLPRMSLDKLLEDGVLVGVCDLALTVNSMHFAEKMKMEPADVKKDWVAGIFPGVQIVPSGVIAIHRAQQLGCTYCYAGEG